MRPRVASVNNKANNVRTRTEIGLSVFYKVLLDDH